MVLLQEFWIFQLRFKNLININKWFQKFECSIFSINFNEVEEEKMSYIQSLQLSGVKYRNAKRNKNLNGGSLSHSIDSAWRSSISSQWNLFSRRWDPPPKEHNYNWLSGCAVFSLILSLYRRKFFSWFYRLFFDYPNRLLTYQFIK